MKLSLAKNLRGANGTLKINIDLEIGDGKLVTLYGESGVGKTSILRMISGLLQPDDGLIRFSDAIWFDSALKVNVKPQQRDVGFVFQDYALFPNMTVKENLEFAAADKEDEVIDELLVLMELVDLQDRKPDTLSGGQKQRVALARALVRKPKLLLLDEPMSALDRKMRSKLQEYILNVHRKFGLTTILVSHETGEIFKMSDEVLVLSEGAITFRDTPAKLFSGNSLSGKFKFTGEVVSIEKEGVVYIVSVLIGNDLVKVVADSSEIENLKEGDQVLVASKAFNPIIQKI
ncbi:MAG: ABC transporter ATP-binding protein [Cyclobacteriaceae bacterium]|nr:ABC transporter ATP-binding protein [Cyclobacteriaceae bacterium]